MTPRRVPSIKGQEGTKCREQVTGTMLTGVLSFALFTSKRRGGP